MNKPSCPFCSNVAKRVLFENELAFCIRDGFPVTELHSLIIPRRHIADFFVLTPAEVRACNELLHQTREEILARDSSVEGFNIGVNVGAVAGQTVSHVHVHLIPRRRDDLANPRGGVRNVIPGKGDYSPG